MFRTVKYAQYVMYTLPVRETCIAYVHDTTRYHTHVLSVSNTVKHDVTL